MKITKGKLVKAQKVIIYGPEGIGKSTFASKFPMPVFSDTEGSTNHLDVFRFDGPSSWTMLLNQVEHIKQNPKTVCQTYVIDTADWAEILCIEHVCSKAKKTGIEEFGYGKGYTYLEEEFGRLLNKLNELIDLGINVVITAHSQMRKFEQPDEQGAYDRYELKLEKKTAALLKEWADIILFANYKTKAVNVDGQGVAKGKNKPQGNKRIMYTIHHPCWDAKNRHDLPEELPFEYSAIAHCIPTTIQAVPSTIEQDVPRSKPEQTTNPLTASADDEIQKEKLELPSEFNDLPKSLADLMSCNNVTIQEIQDVVTQRGYYPEATPIKNYDPQFIDGVLVGAWEQVFTMIKTNRDGFKAISMKDEKELPF